MAGLNADELGTNWTGTGKDRYGRYYLSPFGAKRYISAPSRGAGASDLSRELKNLPEQMGAALLMNRAQVRLFKQRAPLVLQMHDQFMMEVPEDEADKWTTLLRETMEIPVPELDNESIPVDVKVGRNWGNYSEENPWGLKNDPTS